MSPQSSARRMPYHWRGAANRRPWTIDKWLRWLRSCAPDLVELGFQWCCLPWLASSVQDKSSHSYSIQKRSTLRRSLGSEAEFAHSDIGEHSVGSKNRTMDSKPPQSRLILLLHPLKRISKRPSWQPCISWMAGIGCRISFPCICSRIRPGEYWRKWSKRRSGLSSHWVSRQAWESCVLLIQAN